MSKRFIVPFALPLRMREDSGAIIDALGVPVVYATGIHRENARALVELANAGARLCCRPELFPTELKP